MKKIFISLLMTLVVISICSCASSNYNTDDEIIETSSALLEAWGLEEGRTFSVVLDDQDIYHVDINGQELLVEIKKDSNTKNAKSNIAECDSEILDIVKASKENVINYINNSNILRDKEELVEYINNIPVRMADFAIDEAVEYDSEYDSIFINNSNRTNACAYTITHELVNALCQKTNGDDVRYQDSIFNETLTKTIIFWMHPESIDNIYIDKYDEYMIWVELYLGCMGMDGIEAYFYGYDEILERIPEAELDIFVESLEKVDNNEDAVIIICNCINDWGLEK